MTTEEKLIKLIKTKGDKKAASELISIYYKDIYTYVFRQIKNQELAKDLTQEIFISVLKSIISFDGSKSSFKTWLYKISSNKIIDYYRSKYYRYTSLVEEIDNYDIVSSYDLEGDFQLKEEVAEVMDIVNTLSSNLQQIFRLKIFADMTFRDIGNLLELSESTVKTRYYSTIRKIQKVLEVNINGQV